MWKQEGKGVVGSILMFKSEPSMKTILLSPFFRFCSFCLDLMDITRARLTVSVHRTTISGGFQGLTRLFYIEYDAVIIWVAPSGCDGRRDGEGRGALSLSSTTLHHPTASYMGSGWAGLRSPARGRQPPRHQSELAHNLSYAQMSCDHFRCDVGSALICDAAY